MNISLSNIANNSNPFNAPRMSDRHNAHRTFFTNERVLERIEQIKQRIGEQLKDSMFMDIPEELLEEAILEDANLYDILV